MLTVQDLIFIRRRVDKATKRAQDRTWDDYREWTRQERERAWLGMVTIPASALAKTLDDNMGCDLTVGVVKGDYSPIYPASIGPNVSYMERPRVLAATAHEASLWASLRNPELDFA